jgi:ABC-2 type transport system ATP-binding protein
LALESSPAVSAARPPPTAPPAIVVEHLHKSYSGRPVVRDLSFTVQSGEVFALLGPNGAGKTTTLEIVEGYRTPDAGTVRVLGLDPQRQGDALHRRIGLMLQQGGFYPAITPAEALELFASFYERPADPAALLHLVGLEEAARTRYRRLSGGQKQRLSLAVALVGQPELVFLDEPTAGMDPQARRATWEIIRALKARGVTIVLTTHLLDEAERLADRIAIVDGGRLIALGTLAELTGGNGLGDVVLTLAAPIDLAELRKLPAVLDARASRPDQVVLRSASPPDLLVELTAWLRDQGIVPREIRCGQGSLEDVFLALTDSETETFHRRGAE